MPIKFPKSVSQKQKIFQSKTFGFNKILSCFVSLNTKILHIPRYPHMQPSETRSRVKRTSLLHQKSFITCVLYLVDLTRPSSSPILTRFCVHLSEKVNLCWSCWHIMDSQSLYIINHCIVGFADTAFLYRLLFTIYISYI